MILVEKALGLVTIQGLARHGEMHRAVPPGGALVPELLVAANRAAGNPDDAPAFEVLGELVVRMPSGDVLRAASGPRRCAYLAIPGGLARPASFVTQPIRSGEHVAIGAWSAPPSTTAPFVDSDLITIIPGPDLDAFTAQALELLTTQPYRILPISDRVGTRLAGPTPLPREPGYRERSRPMVQGALEVPGDGQPIVLGPEHPTTGGYPVIAVIANTELGRFHANRLGAPLRFRVTSSR